MMRFGENRDDFPESLAALLALFNFSTAFGSCLITLIAAMTLAGRLLDGGVFH
jgi:hypothetical protein